MLGDGLGNYYVGQSNQVDRRIKEHARDKSKKGFEVVARFFVGGQGGAGAKDILRMAEQYIYEEVKQQLQPGKKLINKKNPIDLKRGRLRNAFRAFCK